MARGQRRQVLLRLDPAVHAAVAKWAADDLRSVNAQIEIILRRALADAGRGVEAADSSLGGAYCATCDGPMTGTTCQCAGLPW